VTCRHIRASYNDETITVYQAYSQQIADAALAAGTFVAPFKRNRMTWIKPSFLWMMYRSGWATKSGQERILSIQVTRDGFDWALAHSVLSHYHRDIYSRNEDWLTQRRSSPVLVQWDPDRSLTLAPLSRRAIQIGLGGEAVDRYLDRWIYRITDIANAVIRIREHVKFGDLDVARQGLPFEDLYPLPESIRTRTGASRAG
jgi:hypothetical protein